MAPDDKHLDALEKALNDASSKASALWVTFTTFELYLAIAYGSVTHRNLFLEDPIRLPLLNVDLPLVAFFVVAPSALVIIHAYVLLQIYALSGRAREYDKLLVIRTPTLLEQWLIRQRLDPFLVLQYLVGPKNSDNHIYNAFLGIIIWITLVAAPILLTLQAQVTFLPFHYEEVTWWQRFLVILQFALTWRFWATPHDPESRWLGTFPARLSMAFSLALTIIFIAFSVYVVTFPGEHADAWRRMLGNFAGGQTLHDFLFVGAIDEVSGKPRSFSSDRLVLTDQRLIDIDKYEKTETSRSLRGRDLKGAILNRADLRKVDFTGANLDGASFVGAKLQNGQFGCASRETWADMVSESQEGGCTFMRGALLYGAQLQEANLTNAHLQGALLIEAQMQGALLDRAQMQGAWLHRTDLQGASLRGAKLEGARMTYAWLQGALLNGAQLEGAALAGARLHGAALRGASLQGAWLGGAHLRGTSLDGAKVWRAFGKSLVEFTTFDQIDCHSKPWSDSDYQKWLSSVTEEIPDYSRIVPAKNTKNDGKERTYSGEIPSKREDARERLSRLDPNQPDHRDPTWRPDDCHSADAADTMESRIHYYNQIICFHDARPEVARGLVRNLNFELPFYDLGGRPVPSSDKTAIDRAAKLAAAIEKFLVYLRSFKSDAKGCPPLRNFGDADWAKIEDLATRAAGIIALSAAQAGGTSPPAYNPKETLNQQ
jgi:uncharacterized protein YjbI with pentapeptide repeats